MKDEELREQIIEYLNNDHYNLIVDCSVSILTDIIDAIAGFKSHPPQTEKKSSYPETVDQLRGNRVVTSAPSKGDEQPNFTEKGVNYFDDNNTNRCKLCHREFN